MIIDSKVTATPSQFDAEGSTSLDWDPTPTQMFSILYCFTPNLDLIYNVSEPRLMINQPKGLSKDYVPIAAVVEESVGAEEIFNIDDDTADDKVIADLRNNKNSVFHAGLVAIIELIKNQIGNFEQYKVWKNSDSSV